jgi:hypothetical protein
MAIVGCHPTLNKLKKMYFIIQGNISNLINNLCVKGHIKTHRSLTKKKSSDNFEKLHRV